MPKPSSAPTTHTLIATQFVGGCRVDQA